ncbi:aminoglycoside phosphotransferase family protein [Yoonia sp. SS1-5]|uniref:Aminoglycoside phosphotransferase family protein n=1 Tax=Yoonia rhodophyticola TaxID=3137370 RepID=A0AAN0MME0_9RHOB
MISPPDPAPALLADFGVSDPVFVAKSGIATVWKVRHGDGFAALKRYDDGDIKDEGPGFALAQALDGVGMARVFAFRAGAALLEWLDGPSLGDMARVGRDLDAAQIIADVAARVHAGTRDLAISFGTVADSFVPLLQLKPADDLDPVLRHDLARCITLATHLQETQGPQIPLHGDLHHDNIMRGPRGYLAFDAKGILGEPAFEFANTFPNPVGIGDVAYDPARALALADIWGRSTGAAPLRLLQWGAARSALSYAWGSDFGIVSEPRMIRTLLMAIDIKSAG